MKSHQHTVIDTPRLHLRPLQITDTPAMMDIYSDQQTMLYWSDQPVTSQKEARCMVQEDINLAASGTALFWGILLKGSDRVIGKFTLINYSAQNRRAEVGYILNRQHWRNGIMTEALAAVIGFAFSDLGLHRLEADVDVDNEPSLSLLEKLGFRQEGYFRQRWRTYDTWQDSVMFGLLKPDWDQRPRLF